MLHYPRLCSPHGKTRPHRYLIRRVPGVHVVEGETAKYQPRLNSRARRAAGRGSFSFCQFATEPSRKRLRAQRNNLERKRNRHLGQLNGPITNDKFLQRQRQHGLATAWLHGTQAQTRSPHEIRPANHSRHVCLVLDKVKKPPRISQVKSHQPLISVLRTKISAISALLGRVNPELASPVHHSGQRQFLARSAASPEASLNPSFRLTLRLIYQIRAYQPVTENCCRPVAYLHDASKTHKLPPHVPNQTRSRHRDKQTYAVLRRTPVLRTLKIKLQRSIHQRSTEEAVLIPTSPRPPNVTELAEPPKQLSLPSWPRSCSGSDLIWHYDNYSTVSSSRTSVIIFSPAPARCRQTTFFARSWPLKIAQLFVVGSLSKDSDNLHIILAVCRRKKKRLGADRAPSTPAQG